MDFFFYRRKCQNKPVYATVEGKCNCKLFSGTSAKSKYFSRRKEDAKVQISFLERLELKRQEKRIRQMKADLKCQEK